MTIVLQVFSILVIIGWIVAGVILGVRLTKKERRLRGDK